MQEQDLKDYKLDASFGKVSILLTVEDLELLTEIIGQLPTSLMAGDLYKQLVNTLNSI